MIYINLGDIFPRLFRYTALLILHVFNFSPPGEIGGLYGLLLGASVLTLMEFIDFFLYNGVLKCQAKHRRAKRKNKRKQNGQGTYTTGNHVKV